MCVLFYPIALQQFDHPVNYVTAGDPFVLDCTVVGGLKPNDIITFEWSKDNDNINNSNMTQMIQINMINSETSQLVINKLNPDIHNGEYSCKAIYNNSVSNSAFENTKIAIESKLVG